VHNGELCPTLVAYDGCHDHHIGSALRRLAQPLGSPVRARLQYGGKLYHRGSRRWRE
jgi:hypothetical protein